MKSHGANESEKCELESESSDSKEDSSDGEESSCSSGSASAEENHVEINFPRDDAEDLL